MIVYEEGSVSLAIVDVEATCDELLGFGSGLFSWEVSFLEGIKLYQGHWSDKVIRKVVEIWDKKFG